MSAYQEEDMADYQEMDENEQYDGDDQGPYESKQTEHDLEPDEMKKRVQEMEEELEKLTTIQQQVDKQITNASDRLDENSM